MTGGASSAVQEGFRALFQAGTSAGLTDGELLARFLDREGPDAEAAFAAIVDRHAPGVLRVCRGVLADRHDAEDAAQATFLVLARRAGSIRKGESLACWLFGAALRIAKRSRTEAARRRVREARGAQMAASHRREEPRPEPWDELYEELGRLPEKYRRPLVLCHLEGLSYAEAARQLACPERTVHGRLMRGRARLRDRLIRRGLAPSAGLVAAGALADAARAVEVPPIWAEATRRAALSYATGPATGIASTAAIAHAQGALRAMLVAKIELAALSVAIASAALTGLLALAQGPMPARPADPDPRAAAGGPAGSTPTLAPRIGRVFDSDGTPLAGAEVAFAGLDPTGTLAVVDGRLEAPSGFPRATTDAEGRFTVPTLGALAIFDYRVVVAHDRGFADVPCTDFEDIAALTVQPWGRIEGRLKVGDRPAAGVPIRYASESIEGAESPATRGRGTTTTDPAGRFVFERVLPGDVRVASIDPDGRRGASFNALAIVHPGESARVDLGGAGRPVVARVVLPGGFDSRAFAAPRSGYSVESDRPMVPREIQVGPRDRRLRWAESPTGRAYRAGIVRRGNLGDLGIGPNGEIRVEDLPPDRYRLMVILRAGPIDGPNPEGRGGASAVVTFTVPEIPGGRTDEPLDLGEIRPEVRQPIAPK